MNLRIPFLHQSSGGPFSTRLGIFDPRFSIGEDTDWLIRAKIAGIRMAILPDVLVQRRIHGFNLCYGYEKPGVRSLRLIKLFEHLLIVSAIRKPK